MTFGDLDPDPLPFKQLSYEQVLFGQHALFAVIKIEANGAEGLFDQRLFCSGFTMEVGGSVFWITAGHVANDLVRAVGAGYVIGDSRFMDYGIKQPLAFPAYITLESLDHVDHSDRHGADYAIVELNSLTQSNLTAGGVSPIHESGLRRWGSFSTNTLSLDAPQSGQPQMRAMRPLSFLSRSSISS